MDHRIYLVIYNHPEHGLLQDETLLAREVVDDGIANEMSLHPAADFEHLSNGVTPPYIKRWLAFEPWDE